MCHISNTDSGYGAGDGCMNEFLFDDGFFCGFKGYLAVRSSDIESSPSDKLHINA